MTTATAQLNNVNIAAIGILVEAIAAEPEHAETTWHASVEWDGRMLQIPKCFIFCVGV